MISETVDTIWGTAQRILDDLVYVVRKWRVSLTKLVEYLRYLTCMTMSNIFNQVRILSPQFSEFLCKKDVYLKI